MVLFFISALTLAGALLYRHRGGWLPTRHTQVARLDFSAGMALLLALVTWDWRMAAALPLWFVGCFAPNGDWMNVRSNKELLWGCYSGLINVGPVVPLTAFLGYWWLTLALLIAGALKGPAYWLGNRVPWPWSTPQFQRGPEMGEVLFGAVLGASLAVNL